MMRSGLQLVSVLENLGRETPNRSLRKAVIDVARRVTEGADLADAMDRHPRQFNSVFVGLVRSGIESGRLSDALSHIVEYLERVEQVNRRVTSAAIYPVFVLLTFVATSGGMIFNVLPRYETIFRGSGKHLPAPTQFLIDLGRFLSSQGVALLLLGAALAGSFLLVLAHRQSRLVWDRAKLRLPILGSVWRLAALSRFSRTLAVQVSNGVSLIQALHLAAGAAGNRYVETLAHGIAGDIELGESITGAFKARDIFSGIVLQMISSGEESGRIDELLLSAANYFDSLLMQRIEAVTGLINPILTGFVGLSTAGMMVASFLPVFAMPGAMQ